MDNITIDIDGKGWTIDMVKTEADIDQAELYLNEAIVKIEMQLEIAESDPTPNLRWKGKAKMALRMKKQGLQHLARKRKALKIATTRTWERRFCQVVLDLDPELHADAVEITNREISNETCSA